MPRLPDWTVPAGAQPKPEDYNYDLDRALGAVVGIRSVVPADAFSAETLGTERAGNGVLIREDGIVLTIGYLITEAEQVWLTFSDGRVAPGHVLGYDQETGLGWCRRWHGRSQADPTRQSGALQVGERVVVGGAATGAFGGAAWPPSELPAIGSTCWTRRFSRRPRIRGAAPR
jgi:S1-C subfamily serine protease